MEDRKIKKVITYGTFDLFHIGHLNVLKRAKALGDYLVVAISTDEFNLNEKNKVCKISYKDRAAIVEAIKYVDEVVPETSWNQKTQDIETHDIDVFVMGDDWIGKFDYLQYTGVEVVYLERTPDISSSQIKQELRTQ